jgi:FHA domain
VKQLLSWISLFSSFVFIPAVYAQENALSAGTLVFSMGFVVLLILLALLGRVLWMKPSAIPETSAPPRQGPEQAITRIYGELLVLDGLNNKDRILVTKAEFSIGRGLENNDYELNLPGISRRHLILFLDPNDKRMYIRDLDSANGTLLNGKPLSAHQNHPLYAGDEITLSQLVLKWNPLRGVEGAIRPKNEAEISKSDKGE